MPLIFWHLFLTRSANCLSDYFFQFLYFYWSSMEHPAPAISLLMYYIIVYNCRDLFCCLHPFLLSLLCKFSSSPLNLSLVYGSSTCLLFMMDFLSSFHHFLLPSINSYFCAPYSLFFWHLTGLAMFCCMPTTLSSGVTLTQLVGGNSALALAMTVASNLLGIIIVSKILL
ncbi:putative sodium/metabolite cotransporter BASS4 chloroplastic [Zea mays]|uniref:Putative sodium/metabolite cotransporter BASS4 chloroplastic n=1 Tax=Zea mays TaxID=4577 RepID=A0A1D6H9W0_MAIZE|nr:putative sodium/metabolite cotransporter BASS4 chloroplastic [Zea mays]AQK71499.1 putative sodium/metabolite cotransporter BASS4 chloroplastic [Zea mays]AQK71502.1 putative sodium/metabolite cotransporter BASS4 chloroplastic [Zea mays]AQK71503.1 putative sodium/metabolite cotransporter BASS4 chloroplastic [Zea mays]